MADLQPTDTLLVNRTGIDYSVAQADVMATVQDTDLLLINRAGVDYNATYADVKKGFGPQKIEPAPGDWTFNPAIVSGTGTQADPFIITPETVPAAGGTVQSAQTLTLTGLNNNDLVEWTDHSVGAGNRFHQLMALVPPSGQVDLKLDYTDTPASTADQVYTGDLQIGTSYFRWIVTQQVSKAPDVGSVTLSDVAGGDRFTSTAFPVSATMPEDGVPTSTKGLKAYVEGALKSAALTSAITAITPTTTQFGAVRFTAARSTYLSRTFAAEGNRKTWTWSGWVKRAGALGTEQHLFAADAPVPTDSNYGRFFFVSSDVLSFHALDSVWRRTTVTLSEAASWHHVLIAVDTTQPTADDRVKIYIDGTQVTSFSITTDPNQNDDLGFSRADVHMIGARSRAGIISKYFDGYLADVYFIDGLALDPTAFRNADGTANVYTGPFGNNGFHLTFATDSSIGIDSSGNGNHWTAHAFQASDWSFNGPGGSSTELELTDNTQLANFAAGDVVTEVGNGDDGTGTVASVDAAKPSITLGGLPPNWDVGSKVKGPLKAPAGGASVRLYCVLDAAGNVSDLQSADPGFTAWTPAGTSPGPYTGNVTFPALLPSGQPPDTDLPAGTDLTVEVQASNASGTDSAVSNTIIPA